MLGANLPALTFTRIYVTKLSVRAQYTKLKTKPIELLIDEIYVEITEPVHVETDPAPEASSPQQYVPSLRSLTSHEDSHRAAYTKN